MVVLITAFKKVSSTTFPIHLVFLNTRYTNVECISHSSLAYEEKGINVSSRKCQIVRTHNVSCKCLSIIYVSRLNSGM